MKFKILMLYTLVSIAFLTIIALCADWDNQQSLSADQLIGGGEVQTYQNPAGMPSTPKASRALQQEKGSLDWTMPSTLGETGKNPKESRSISESASQDSSSQSETNSNLSASTSNSVSSTTETELPPSPGPSTESVAGSWSFTLSDGKERDATVTLFQNGKDLFGSGNMKVENDTIQLGVSGYLEDNLMNLDLVSLGTINMYKMALNVSGDSANGDYRMFSVLGDIGTGNAVGERTATM